eukprot:c20154_g3_i1 orf=49-231(+)
MSLFGHFKKWPNKLIPSFGVAELFALQKKKWPCGNRLFRMKTALAIKKVDRFQSRDPSCP